jgi:FKBP-type peptidyl-prolyl cis-trans isomerase FkpA
MVLRQGAGLRPKATDRVRVNYHGTLPDGTVFDSSVDRGQPIDFALNQVIAGWTEGVSMMPVGAKYRFWIPGDLAYGARGTPGGPIGPNQMLIFDVELLDIVQ